MNSCATADLKISKMLACHCLNVTIEAEEGTFLSIANEELGLSQEESRDSFFQQEIQQVGKLNNISKSHSGLVQTRNVGSWVVHYCVNCGVHSHAVHRERGASGILVSCKLLSSPVIEDLKSSERFSLLFKIIVSSEEFEDDPTKNSYLPGEVENVIRGFKQIASEVLKKEADAVEERIKQYTYDQYSKLSDLRERAYREQQVLSRIVINNFVNSSQPPESTNIGKSNHHGTPSRLNEPLAAGSITFSAKGPASPLRLTPKRQKSCPSGHANSIDSETLFEFEGIDDVHSQSASDVGESDVEEPEHEIVGMIKIPRSQTSDKLVAKSVPVTIPPFTARNKSRSFEEDEPPFEKTLDIAASIKALAKSVHGDTVFGDLPKPRYTYI